MRSAAIPSTSSIPTSTSDSGSWEDTIFCPGSKTVKIEPDQMCNGKVDCPGAKDEIDCSCRTRIDSSNLCDDVFDCPSIEDELGCSGICFHF